MRSITLLTLTGICVATVCQAQAPKLDEMDVVLKSVPDGPVAKVDDRYIPRHEFVRLYQTEIERLRRERGDDNIPDGARIQLARMCIGILIERALLYDEAQRQGVEVPQEQVEKAWEAQLAETRQLVEEHEGESPTEEEVLRRIGYANRDEALDRLEMALLTEKMRARVVRESGLAVEDETVRAYYEANKTRFSRPAALRLRQIYVNPKMLDGSSMDEKRALAAQVANEALNRVYAGQRFASVAETVSHAPDAQRGGDMGLIPTTQLPSFMVNAAANLEPGECSEVLHSEFGCHVIQLVEVNEPVEADFETVAPLIRRELLADEAAEVVHAYADSLIENGAEVRIFLELDKNLALAQSAGE